jgi:transcription initiation factor TFIIB
MRTQINVSRGETPAPGVFTHRLINLGVYLLTDTGTDQNLCSSSAGLRGEATRVSPQRMHALSRQTEPVVSTPGNRLRTEQSRCPSCEQFVKVVGVKEAVCPDCDVVVTETPITLRARPVYGEENRSRRRAGGRFTLQYPDRGLGVGTNSKEWDKPWLNPWTTEEYRLGYPLGEIQRMGSRLAVSDPEREHAAKLYRRAHTQGKVKGRSTDGFAAACLLVAVRQSAGPHAVSERELLRVSRADRAQLRNARTVLEVKMGEEVPPMQPGAFLPAACSQLGTPAPVRQCARVLLDARAGDPEAVESFSPRTLAAAGLYAAYDVVDDADAPTLAEFSEVFDVSVSTISRRKGVMLAYRSTWESSPEAT